MGSLNAFKRALISSPGLALPRLERTFMIDADASAYQIGAVLLQKQDEDKPSSGATIIYWSNALTKPERNYSTMEREYLSVF